MFFNLAHIATKVYISYLGLIHLFLLVLLVLLFLYFLIFFVFFVSFILFVLPVVLLTVFGGKYIIVIESMPRSEAYRLQYSKVISERRVIG